MSVPTHRSILVNDDGWIISEAQPPLTARDLKEKMVDTYHGTPLGALLWCIGNREVYHFETRVGEMFGAGYDSLEGLTPGEEFTLFDDRDQANHAANIRSLIERARRPPDRDGRALPGGRAGHLPVRPDEQPLRYRPGFAEGADASVESTRRR